MAENRDFLLISGALGRIATALEAIATGAAPESRTPFPWHAVPKKVRRAVLRHQDDDFFPDRYKARWPWGCEDLMEIGCTRLRTLHYFGDVAAREIASQLTHLGFDDWEST